MPNALETVIETHHRFPDIDIYYTDLLCESAGGYVKPLRSSSTITPDAFAEGFCLYGSNVISKEIWTNVGGYCHTMHSLGDLDFYIGALEQGARFRHIREPLYLYRSRPGSNSSHHLIDAHSNYNCIGTVSSAIICRRQAARYVLGLGCIISARAQIGLMNMSYAKHLAEKGLIFGRTKEANALLRRIARDRYWPRTLLKLRRNASVFLEHKLMKYRFNKYKIGTLVSRDACNPWRTMCCALDTKNNSQAFVNPFLGHQLVNVLHVVPTLCGGGAERFVSQLIKHQLASGIKARACIFRCGMYDVHGVATYQLPFSWTTSQGRAY